LDPATGGELWSRFYDGNLDYDVAMAVAISHDSKTVYVTGSLYMGQAESDDAGTIAYDTTTGVDLWTSHFTGAGPFDDLRVSLSVSPDDSKLYAALYSYSDGDAAADAVAMGFDAT